jgi:hypothetical protein
MSALGQLQTHAPQQTASLFDHLVGANKQVLRYGKSERFCGLEIDNQLEPGRLQDRKISRLIAFKDTASSMFCRMTKRSTAPLQDQPSVSALS